MIIVSYASSNDRWIRSNNSNYATALAGSNLQVNEDNIGVIGQTYASSENQRYIRQYFMEFQHSIPAGQQAVSGYWAIRNNVTHGTNINRDWEVLRYNFGTSVTTGSWRTPAQLRELDQDGLLDRSNANANSRWTFIGHQRVLNQLYNSGTRRYVMITNRNRTQSSPTQVEYNSIISSRAANAAFRPHLVVGTTTEHAMLATIAAQVQLSDGSWVVLERSSLGRVFTIQLRHITTTSSNVFWVSHTSDTLTENDNILGSHSYSLCRDNSNNIFMVDCSWSQNDRLNVKPFTRTSGVGGFNEIPFRSVTLPSDHGRANVQATACVWHPVGSGRIITFSLLDWGMLGGTQESWTLLDSQRLISGSGTWLLDSGRGGVDGLSARPANVGRYNPINSTGTLVDAHKDESGDFTGYFLTGERSSLLGETGALSMARYQIHSGGTRLNTNTISTMDTTGGYSVYDPDAKARVISVGAGRFIKVTADDRPDWGLTLDHVNVGHTGSTFNKLGTIRMDAEEDPVPSLPDGASLGTSQLWDAVWFPVDNNAWLYYFDDADDRRLMRTAVSLSDSLAELNEVEVDAAVGNSGDIVHAIRVQRNRLVSDQVLITTAVENSVGEHRYEYIIDRINVAPTQPTLVPIQNYDSVNDQTFNWTFHDPNLVDEQTAFQLRIIRVSDSGVEFDTGKITSGTESYTLSGSGISNNEDYLWQVRTWDVADESSPWSAQSSFTTSNTGVVVISDPDTDNDPDIFTMDYLVEWELTGAAQDQYRVRLLQTLDGFVHTDTGWVTNSGNTHLITEMLSDVEYRIEVTTRASMVESNVATRLITTHYSTPEAPITTIFTSVDAEFLRIAVENPEPRGDRPNPSINEIYRRHEGSDDQFLKVGECPINGSFRDYTVASGTRYEYKARAGVVEGS